MALKRTALYKEDTAPRDSCCKKVHADKVFVLALAGPRNVFSSYMTRRLAIFWIESRNPILLVIKTFFHLYFFHLKKCNKCGKGLNCCH